jgi:hypothetical protein
MKKLESVWPKHEARNAWPKFLHVQSLLSLLEGMRKATKVYHCGGLSSGYSNRALLMWCNFHVGHSPSHCDPLELLKKHRTVSEWSATRRARLQWSVSTYETSYPFEGTEKTMKYLGYSRHVPCPLLIWDVQLTIRQEGLKKITKKHSVVPFPKLGIEPRTSWRQCVTLSFLGVRKSWPHLPKAWLVCVLRGEGWEVGSRRY